MSLIPRSVKVSTIVGMGLQIALVGMTSVKLVVPNEDTIVGLGPIDNYQVWLVIIGLVVIGSALYHQVPGGILLGIIIMTIVTWIIDGSYPTEFVQFPDFSLIDPRDYISFADYDFMKCLPAISAFLFVGVIDVSGVLFGMASLADITEPDGKIPGSTAAFVSTAISTMVSAILGGTPIIIYVESAAGIKEGGKTGLTANFIGLFFFLSLVFAPILSTIPVTATSPVAILVGAMMMGQATEIDWNNMSEAIPAFLTLIVMPFTFSITNGIMIGLITAFMFYITTGQMFLDIMSVYDRIMYGGAEDPELIAINGMDNSNRSRNSVGTTGESVGEGTGNNFMDFQPFVRTPSLIIPKEEATAMQQKHASSSVDSTGRSLEMQNSQIGKKTYGNV